MIKTYLTITALATSLFFNAVTIASLFDAEGEIAVLKQKLSTLEADHNASCHYLNEAYLELDYAESWRNEIASKRFCPPPPLMKG